MISCPHCKHANPDDSTFCIECGKPLAQRDSLGTVDTPLPGEMLPNQTAGLASVELEPGSLFADRYTIVERIGQGGMGVVYRATETLGSRDREIALKLIRADRLADQKAIDRLVGEGVLTQDIRHPNVVSVYNVGVAADKPFVAMEFVEGVSLRDWIRVQMNAQKEAPLETVSALLHNILDGLDAAHKVGVIHRDLKPENIILTSEPGPDDAPLKILDFGIARAPGTVDAMTGTGLGTPNYMAPEQITNPMAASASADLYSLSVIFYELLMGVLPKGHWQPPSGGRGDVPEPVDKLIQDGLSNRPLSRPQDVAAYRARLDDALGAMVPEPEPQPEPEPEPTPTPAPTPAPVPVPPPPPDNKAGKKWLMWLGGGLGALFVLGLLAPDEDPPENGPYPPTPTPSWTQTDNPPEPPAAIGYEDYSGRWNYNAGSYLDINVDSDGSFDGRSYNNGQYSADIEGSLALGEYVVSNQIAALPGVISLAGCHANFTTFNPNGTINLQGQFHVDHDPGAACPARFGSR